MSETENDFSEETKENYYSENSNNEPGEKFRDKSILEAVLDRERPLKTLQRRLEGKEEVNGEWKQVRLPRARDEIISLIIISLSSVISSSHSFADIDPDKAKVIIYEKILEFEYLAVEEVTIKEEDFETIINICDHALELFFSSIENGHMTNALKDIFSGSNNQIQKNEKEGFFKEMFGELKPKK